MTRIRLAEYLIFLSIFMKFRSQNMLRILQLCIGLFALTMISPNAKSDNCSDEWLQCRRNVRADQNSCSKDCDDDSKCRRKCSAEQNTSYQDCDAERASCRASDNSDANQSRDSSRSQVPRTFNFQRPMIASVCATNFGTCPMQVATQTGYPCYCVTPNGPLPGVAR